MNQTLNTMEELNQLDKEFTHIVLNKCPAFLNRIEKLVYYFNRIEGLTLIKIAEELGYSYSNILKIGSSIKRKLNNNKSKQFNKVK